MSAVTFDPTPWGLGITLGVAGIVVLAGFGAWMLWTGRW